MTVTVFLLALGATARLTRLINADVIADRVRVAVWERWGVDSHPGVLVRCPWCISPYVGALVLAAGWAAGWAAWWLFVAAVLSISYVVAVAAHWLDPEE